MSDEDIRDAEQRRAQSTAIQLNERFAVKRSAGRPRKVEQVVQSAKVTDDILWREAMLVAMRNRDIKAPTQLRTCTEIADEYIKMFKERFI